MENDLRIFAEFKDAEFRGSKYRPDKTMYLEYGYREQLLFIPGE